MRMSSHYLKRLFAFGAAVACLAAAPASAAVTSSWYFVDTGTTALPSLTASATVPVSSNGLSTTGYGSWYYLTTTTTSGGTGTASGTYAAYTTNPVASSYYATASSSSVNRAPGLAPDMTSYYWNGTYLTPSMVFASSPWLMNNSSLSFNGRNSVSGITFSGLPQAGSMLTLPKDLGFSYGYRNGATAQPVYFRTDVFDPQGNILGTYLNNRSLNGYENAAFSVSSTFGSGLSTDGIYNIRVRAYGSDQNTILDENSFNVQLQR